LKWYKSLQTSKGRDDRQAFLVEGHRAIRQIAQVAGHRIKEIIYSEEMKEISGLARPFHHIPSAQFRSISLSQHPSGPLAVVTLPEDCDRTDLPSLCGNKILVLEDIQDPGNAGTLVRSAAAFDFSGIVCSDKCADLFSPKAVQASCGAMVSMWLRRTPAYRTIMESLKSRGFRIVAADVRGSESKMKFSEGENLAVVLGNEGAGISPETLRSAHDVVKIPFNDKKVESLNVAASGAIIMYLTCCRA
jgi:TrmH family RNA methyltransferase